MTTRPAFAALAIAAALVTPAMAQNTVGPSDAYICYHGAASEADTDAACARIQAEASQPIPRPAPSTPAATNTTVSAAANVDEGVPPDGVASAQPPPTDVGETPIQAARAQAGNTQLGAAVNGDQSINGDEGGSATVSIRPSWLWGFGPAMVGVFALAAFAGLAFYFLPTILAMSRRKGNTPAIFILNLLLGWTFIGWVVALVWSLTAEPSVRRT